MSEKRNSLSDAGSGKLKVRYKVHVVQRNRRSRLVEGAAPPEPQADPEPQGTVPRISRLLALAHHIQELIETGQARDLAEVARRGHVTRARVTQIMNMLLLAPEIQEEILFLPPTAKGKDPITLRGIREVVGNRFFDRQRTLWRRRRSASSSS